LASLSVDALTGRRYGLASKVIKCHCFERLIMLFCCKALHYCSMLFGAYLAVLLGIDNFVDKVMFADHTLLEKRQVTWVLPSIVEHVLAHSSHVRKEPARSAAIVREFQVNLVLVHWTWEAWGTCFYRVLCIFD
jgi:hypothetical protein